MAVVPKDRVTYGELLAANASAVLVLAETRASFIQHVEVLCLDRAKAPTLVDWAYSKAKEVRTLMTKECEQRIAHVLPVAEALEKALGYN